MTREELLQFIEKTGLIRSLPPETNPERIIDAIKKANEGALPLVEKTVKDLYEKQKRFQKEMGELEAKAAALVRKGKKIITRYSETKEEVLEEKYSEELFKDI